MHGSRYFLGLDKQDVFLSILEFIARQRKGIEGRDLILKKLLTKPIK